MAATEVPIGHHHVFLGKQHHSAERRTWMVIWLCGAMMALEIVGGWAFGSIALIADGLHMSTHAGALLLAALAYTYSRKYSGDARFTFGTGKLGDLAGFTSAIVLAMIALLIGYEAVTRIVAPVPIHFREAIPIAALGLAVNLVSAWLLSRSGHDHHHGHGHGGHGHGGHGHGSAPHPEDEAIRVETVRGVLMMSVFETDHPPVFRLRVDAANAIAANDVTIETLRTDGSRHSFTMSDHGGYLQSVDEIPEPHAFTAIVHVDGAAYPVEFEEHGHDHANGEGTAHRDNNMRAAIIHVIADAAVSVLVIVGLLLARAYGWLWMDPLAGILGAVVIASWSYGLIRDTGAILLDMSPDPIVERDIRRVVEADGDQLHDLHVWRLGPGHLGTILSVVTKRPRNADYYRERLAHFPMLSHLTIEVQQTSDCASSLPS